MKLRAVCLTGLSLLAFSVPGKAQTFAYVTNAVSSNISAYTVDPITGALTPVAGSPFAAGTDVNFVTVHPSGRFLYVTNEVDGSIGAYSINPVSGALAPVAGSPFLIPAARASCVKVHPSGTFLYVADEANSAISAYAINPSTGALTPIAGSPFATGKKTDNIALDPAGRFLYASSGDQDAGPGFVLAFTINSTTGALAPIAGSPFAAGVTNTGSVVVDPQGRFVYAANYSDGTISAFTINSGTGALTPIAGSPFADGGAPDQVTVDPAGKVLYAANDGNAGDGGPGPAGVSAFSINSGTGALTPVAGSPFTAAFPAGTGSEPSGVTVDPTGRFLYVPDEGKANVKAFSISPGTGGLTALSGSPFAAGTEPGKIALAVIGASAIPTLSPSGLIAMALLLAGKGLIGARRSRRSV